MWWCIPDTSGERLNGIQEVNSSILSVSTIKIGPESNLLSGPIFMPDAGVKIFFSRRSEQPELFQIRAEF